MLIKCKEIQGLFKYEYFMQGLQVKAEISVIIFNVFHKFFLNSDFKMYAVAYKCYWRLFEIVWELYIEITVIWLSFPSLVGGLLKGVQPKFN